MQRRLILVAGAGVWTLPTWAHHGWSNFDADRPIYLEGKAAKVAWRNPHAEVELELASPLKLPGDLAKRAVPPQSAAVDAPSILAKTVLPTRTDKRWELELAPLSRMQAWQVAEIKPGTPLSVVAYTFPGEKGEAIARVEYLFVDGKAYALRSSPA
ncbi:DUF6152 family protein [Piscinibacter sp. HJYY11]|uniref:DUF6152 family protein n=1 Tax=Piscinibacter sp. HJYY11 TaxID=2801333 RepID=UPI00191E1540|nr:DUF6152 family protein [Piscinibacter sp. HJYY11]MBL0730168.1 hypothetical protein [Piscinibacter sp. HJYY11]